MRSRVALFLVRLVIGGAFVVAGSLKAGEPGAFIRDIWNFRAVPETWAYGIAAYLPYLEIAAGLGLVSGLQRRGAHLLLGAMLLAFLTLHASAWVRGLDVTCGCFGHANATSGMPPAGWIAVVLALLAGVVWSAIADLPKGARGRGEG